jgi:hypothetical protein
MSRNLKPLSALFAFAVLVIAGPSSMAQTSRSTTQGRRITAKAAVVAIKREDKLQLVGEKDRLIRAMQKALNGVKEGVVVTDISIRSFEKVNYLAVLIEREGTLFLQLEPSDGGIAGIYYVGDEKYLYCASAGCTACDLVMTGPVTVNGLGGPHCECDNDINQGPSSGCKLMPRLYVNLAVRDFNEELLATGFKEAEAGTSPGKIPKTRKGTTRALESSPERTEPIRRPDF